MPKSRKLITTGLLLVAAAILYIAADVPGQTRSKNIPACRTFDPEQVADLEKAGWEAYYDRNWVQVFTLMVQLNRAQFCMPLWTAVSAAVDVVRAAAAFAPLDNDIPAATAHLQRFYAKARQSAGLHSDAATLAQLEMDYWTVHRQLAQARAVAPDHTGDSEPLVVSLTALHAALFDAPPAAIRRSAELRAQAAVAVDRITGGYSADVADEWVQIGRDLRAAYRVLFSF